MLDVSKNNFIIVNKMNSVKCKSLDHKAKIHTIKKALIAHQRINH